MRSEEHTSELQSQFHLVCRLLLDRPTCPVYTLSLHDALPISNSAGIVIDAVRCAKLALDRGIGGALESPSSYFMKSPPVQYSDNEARRLVEEFIEGDKAGVNEIGRAHV